MSQETSLLRTLIRPVVTYLRDLGTGLARGWDRFWFSPADPTGLALIRIIAGLVLLWTHLATYHQLLNYVGPQAWVDRQAIGQVEELAQRTPWVNARSEAYVFDGWSGRISIWYYIQDPTWIVILHTVFVAAIVCVVFGFCTRTALLLVWIGHLSYINRSLTNWFGMDTMLAFLTLYLLIGPAGATLSLDRWIARYRAARRALWSRENLPDLSLQPNVWANVALRMFQIQMCIVYFCAGTAKLQGTSWWNGTAVYQTLMMYEFAPFDMSWIASSNWLWETISLVGVAMTIGFEIGFAFLIWNRTLRPIVLFVGVVMHLGIGMFMGLGSFQVAMLAGCLAFVSPASLRWLLEVLFRGPRGYQYVYAPRSRSQVRRASFILAADPWHQFELVKTHEKSAVPAGSLLTPEGETCQGYPLFVRVVRALRIYWPLALVTFIPGVSLIARKISRPPSEVLTPAGAKH
jgi:hypothetical protein